MRTRLVRSIRATEEAGQELRVAVARGDADAIGRFRKSHPKAPSLTDPRIIARLARATEAQLVIARELGLASWPRLRDRIKRYGAAQAEVSAGAAELDGDPRTTHLRCGCSTSTEPFLRLRDPVAACTPPGRV
jgi:hypothetical protein